MPSRQPKYTSSGVTLQSASWYHSALYEATNRAISAPNPTGGFHTTRFTPFSWACGRVGQNDFESKGPGYNQV